MKLTHLAIIMALGLVGVTAWLAWDARNDARSSRNQLELYQRQTGRMPADAATVQAQETQLLMQQMAGKNAPARAVASTLPATGAPTLPVSTSGGGPKISMAHVGQAALDSAPPPLSQRQRLVMSMPAIGRVTEYQKQYGFVIITAGATQKLEKGMTFALRRGPGIIGRVKVTEVENTSAVANIDPRTIPAGVSIESGDEVIQDLPPEA